MTDTRRRPAQEMDQEVAHRRPLPAAIPRPVKRMSGRADTSRTPAHVRVIGVELDEDGHTLIRRKLGMKLGKFATSIERQHAALHGAIDVALRATEQAVRRSVRRRRMKPLRGRNSAIREATPW